MTWCTLYVPAGELPHGVELWRLVWRQVLADATSGTLFRFTDRRDYEQALRATPWATSGEPIEERVGQHLERLGAEMLAALSRGGGR